MIEEAYSDKIIEEISVIILAYNDKEVVEKSIYDVYHKLKKLAAKFEIIVVDDCSSDGTTEIVRQIGEKLPELVPIYHSINTGIGNGLRDAFKVVRYNLVQTNCADLPFDVADLGDAVPYMIKENADVCVMVRSNRAANSWFRKLTSYSNYLIIRTLFGIPINDYNFVQLYKKEVVKSIPLFAKDVFVPPELIIKSYQAGYKVVEFKTTFHPRKAGKSKYGHFKYYFETFLDQLKFWFSMRILKKTKPWHSLKDKT
ncbi:MAG: glycosyltransferase family 2 protein [Candidatus Helarchaeota archaeon]